MLKKIIVLGVILMMSLGIFAGCTDSEYKIDIGGEGGSSSGEPSLSGQVRIMLKNDIFARDDDVEITVGLGLTSSTLLPYYMSQERVVILRISAKDFLITNQDDVEIRDLYEAIYEDYSDIKFACTIKKNRYIPNYYETFEIKLNPDIESASGIIQAKAGPLVEEDNPFGESKTIYYAANSEKIAFSKESIEDAQKKLK